MTDLYSGNSLENQYFEQYSDCKLYKPYDLDGDFKDNLSMNILHINIRSINKNIDEFKLYLANLKMYFSIIVITETWMDNEDDWTDFEWNNYDCFHTIRAGRRGGGVTVLTDRALGCSRLVNLCLVNDAVETCAVSFKLNNIYYAIVGVYRPPSSSISDFNHFFFNNINQRIISNSNSVILGDFNIDLLESSPSQAEDLFRDEFRSLHFMPIISVPTRVSGDSSTLIDHIWVNSLCPSQSGSIELPISDHFPIFVSYSNCFLRDDDLVEIGYRKIDNQRVNTMKSRLSTFCNTFSALQSTNIHDKCKIFCNAIDNIYNDCFPVRRKKISGKRYRCPWLTPSILRCIDRKHRLYREMRFGRIEPLHFRQYRNTTCALIKNAKMNYYRNKFESCMGDIKKTWKCINSLTRATVNKQRGFLIDEGGMSVSSDHEVANMFNNYFASIGRSISDSIPDTGVDPLSYVESNVNSFFLLSTDESEIISLVKSFKNKSCNIRSIPNAIYKEIVDVIAGSLSDLINQSYEAGEFPDNLKVGHVIPLHKKGSKNSKTNYRPISTIHTIGKIFEKSMYNRLVKFTQAFDLITANQFGFRQSFSTIDSILKFTNNIYNSLNARTNTIGISLDFQKAFDCLNHDILLGKMYKMGIRGTPLDWFKSYLTNRIQYCVINDKTSSAARISTGCPQGSILSSLLFLIYINDMYRCTNHLNFTHYADDTLIYYSHDDLATLASTTNDGLSDISTWLKSNKLLLNTNKSNYVLFTNRRSTPNLDIMIGDVPIERVASTKFLGIQIDEKLTFADHIQQTKSKLSRAAGIMHKVSQTIPISALRCIYSSLVLPHLTYGVEVWGKSSLSKLGQLQSIQNKCIKLLNSNASNLSITELYKVNKVMNIDNLHKYFTLKRFHKYRHNRNYFMQDQLDLFQIEHDHNTRFASNQNLSVSTINITKYKSSFIYQGTKYYNQISISNKNLNNYNFKKYLKDAIVNGQYI